MADDPDFHRTLYGGMRKLPYLYMEVRRSVFEGAGAFTGHVFENRSIVPFITRLNKGQDFSKFATDWEKTYSRLCLKTGFGAEPVVDGNMLVVGHYGWFTGDAIFAKVAFRAGITDAVSILENAIRSTGSVRRILDSFR